MKVDELFIKLREGEISSNVMFDSWYFVVIPNEHFLKYRDNFSKAIQIGARTNFRSKHFWRHIHAVQDENNTEIHIDHGNMYKNPILGVAHLFFDVIPYFSWLFLHKKKPYDF